MEAMLLVSYSLILDIEGTATAGLHPSYNKEGTVNLNNKRQLNNHVILLIEAYTVNIMNYNDPRNSSTTRKAFALAAGTPLSYDVGYKKDLGKARLDEWIKMINKGWPLQERI